MRTLTIIIALFFSISIVNQAQEVKSSFQDSKSVEDRMRMVYKLHQDGIITNEELAVKKADVLRDL
jgi:hypothetical protein